MKEFNLTVPSELEQIGAILDFMEGSLRALNINRRYYNESMLIFEESLVRLINSCEPRSEVNITIRKKRGLAQITASVPGPELEAFTDQASGITIQEVSRGNEVAIRDVLLQAFEEKLRYSHKGHYNFIKVTVGSKDTEFLKLSLIAVISALVLGMIMKVYCPSDINGILDAAFLVPLQKVYLDILTPLATPALFISVIGSVAKVSSFYDSGKLFNKTFRAYTMTTIIAILASAGLFYTLQPGKFGEASGIGTILGALNPSSAANAAGGAAANAAGSAAANAAANAANAGGLLSGLNLGWENIEPIWNTLVGQFQDMNTLVVLTLAVVLGVAVGRVGNYSSALKELVDAVSTLVNTALELVLAFLPIAAFMSTLSMTISLSNQRLLDVGQMVGTMMLGLGAVVLEYFIVLLLVGRINPGEFFAKYGSWMGSSFIFDTKYTIMNKTMRCCKNVFGISPKLYSFSIPFGSAYNMDGLSSYLMMAGLFIARINGDTLGMGDVLSIGVIVLVLSIAGSLTPASEVTCLVTLVDWMEIPVSSLGILLGVSAVVGVLLKMMNSFGDVAITLAIARKEHLYTEDK